MTDQIFYNPTVFLLRDFYNARRHKKQLSFRN
jgi:hypothetical protein